MIKICISTKQYIRESKDTQKTILAAAVELYRRIRIYEEQNINFERIFNDDQVKYDQHGSFFTFKCQKNHLQLRILYAYLIAEGIPTIVVADYFIKKKNNKNYIKRFEALNQAEPWKIYEQSCHMESVKISDAS